MSLINEALKKAQRQRTEGSEPAQPAPVDAGSTPAPRVTRREKPAGFRSQIMLVVGGAAAVLLAVVAAGGFWLWRSSRPAAPPPKTEVAAVHQPASPAPATVTPPAAAPVATPAATTTATASPPTATATAAETKVPAAAVVETPKPAPATAAPLNPASGQFTLPLPPASNPATVASTPTPAPAAAATVVAEAPKPVERPKPPPHMITIIENLRVAGIRAAGEDSKVLMNDRVYRLNDVVDHELGIRLTGVTAKTLTFEDDHGATYTRNF